MTDYTAPW